MLPGREADLCDAIAAAAGAVRLLTGEPGSGETRLAEELARDDEDDGQAASADATACAGASP